MDTLLQDARFALRVLRRSPGLTLAVLLTLALAIGATSAIFSVVDAVVLRSLPYQDPDRIAVILGRFDRAGFPRVPVSPNELIVYRAQSHSFEGIAAYATVEANLTGVDAPAHLSKAWVTPNLFSVLGVKASLGRTFLEGEDRADTAHVALLGHALWRARFGGDPSVLGRTVSLDGEPFTVVGVLPSGFDLPHKADVWVPIAFTPEQTAAPSMAGGRFLTVLARMKPGVTLASAQRDMDGIAARFIEDYGVPYTKDTGWGITLVSLKEHLLGDSRGALLVLLGAVSFVLLIACANVASLLLARTAARHREIAVRAALGAGRRRLTRQFITESVVLAVAGGAAGLVLATWGIDALTSFVPERLPGVSEIHLDGRMLAFTFAVTITTGLLFGVAPALAASRADPAEVLKEGSRGSAGKRAGRLRRALVVAQVALAFILLVGAGLMIRSLAALTRRSPGFDPSGLLTAKISLPSAKYQDDRKIVAFFDEISRRAQGLPGVRAVGATSILPLVSRNDRGFDIEGEPRPPGEAAHAAEVRSVSDTYFDAMRRPLRSGRWFTDRDRAGAPPVVIVNEALARRNFAGRDPLGRRVQLVDDPFVTIVGVVADARELSLDEEASPTLYFPRAQRPMRTMALVLRASSDPAQVAPLLRAEVRAVDADQPVSAMITMDDVVAQALGPRRLSLLLFAIFAALALVLATVGLYGVTSQSVTQRTREIGVRVALGAEARSIVRMIVGRALALALLGLAAGVVASLALARTLASLVYGVQTYDPLTFLVIGAVLFATTLLASYLPARRAARVDPVIALRAE
jgi:predicted permease